MTISKKIQDKINQFGDGATFKYEQLPLEPQEYTAAAKAIERLIKKGFIKRVSTGVFYKPKKTVFGELKPNEDELLKAYLFEKGNRIAYVTGNALYNRMGLTTQVPKSLKIASQKKRITISIDNLNASPIKSYVSVTNKNFYLLELLDVLKDFNKIVDLDKNAAIKIISNKLTELNQSELNTLIKCSLSYPPRVRAFLGALLEYKKQPTDFLLLKNSLNPLSEYTFGIDKKQLPTAQNWNIK
jgi:DNA primase large subunit